VVLPLPPPHPYPSSPINSKSSSDCPSMICLCFLVSIAKTSLSTTTQAIIIGAFSSPPCFRHTAEEGGRQQASKQACRQASMHSRPSRLIGRCNHAFVVRKRSFVSHGTALRDILTKLQRVFRIKISSAYDVSNGSRINHLK